MVRFLSTISLSVDYFVGYIFAVFLSTVASNHLSPKRMEGSDGCDQLEEDVPEYEKNAEQDLTTLREKLKSCKELSGHNFEESFLLKFLRSRLFEVEATFELLKSYFRLKRQRPEMFSLVSQVMDVFDDDLIRFLPHPNVTGETLVVVKPGKWDPKRYDSVHVIAAGVPFFEKAALDVVTQRQGFIEILDMRDFGWKQMLSLGPFQAKLVCEVSEQCLPIRFKRVHVLYQNRIADILWTLAKPFLSHEFKLKVIFNGHDLGQLYEEVPPSVLPLELGGSWDSSSYTISADQVKALDTDLEALWSLYSERKMPVADIKIETIQRD